MLHWSNLLCYVILFSCEQAFSTMRSGLGLLGKCVVSISLQLESIVTGFFIFNFFGWGVSPVPSTQKASCMHLLKMELGS